MPELKSFIIKFFSELNVFPPLSSNQKYCSLSLNNWRDIEVFNCLRKTNRMLSNFFLSEMDTGFEMIVEGKSYLYFYICTFLEHILNQVHSTVNLRQ